VGDRVAVVGAERRLTYRELDARANRVAHALDGLGVEPGAHLGVHLSNTTEHVEVLLGCFKLRAVPINVNWRYVGDELAYLFEDARLVGLVTDAKWRRNVNDARKKAALPFVLVTGDRADRAERAEGDTVPYDTAVAGARDDRGFRERSPDDRYVLYTGGTTGMPKGVVWRQEDVFFAVLGGGNPGGTPIERPEEIAETVLARPGLRLTPFLRPDELPPEQLVQLALGPLVHASGQWSALGTLLGGGRVVLYDGTPVDMRAVLALVEREEVVGLNVVGDASARPLLEVLETGAERFDVSSVRLLGSGGTTLSAEHKRRLLDAFPNVVAITEAIGSSESPAQAVSVVTRAGGVPPTLTFQPKVGTIVVDEDLREIEPGSGRVGRLATSGRVPLGYYGDLERSARTFVEIDAVRYALPGDMATVDADGGIRLLGRGSLCINTGGEKVYPEEVEAAVTSHPQIGDAVVVGVPDPTWGERVAVVIEPAPGASPPALEELQEHCRSRLAGYKLPRILAVVPRVQRTESGKADYGWAAGVARDHAA
jgi:acyl-CoA synthetase (AMP-forming)/AMP-acid ligase II